MLSKWSQRHKNNTQIIIRLNRILNSLIANISKTFDTLNSTKTFFVGAILTKKLSFYFTVDIVIITSLSVENKLASALQTIENVTLYQSNLLFIELRVKNSIKYQNKLSFTSKLNQSFMNTCLVEYPKKNKL